MTITGAERNMVTVLSQKDWKFAFRVEMVSPRGFRYSAQAELPTTAFLKAIGDWQTDVMPGAKRAIEQARGNHPTSIEVPFVDQRRKSHRPYRVRGLTRDKARYMRDYMRRYRNELVVAVA